MNPSFIISKVEIYDRPKTFNIRPEWYHIKKLDHELPDDIKIEFDTFIKNRDLMEKNGIEYNDKIYINKKNTCIWTYTEKGDDKKILLEGSNVPQEVHSIHINLEYGTFRSGIRSNITGHLYLFEHGSIDRLGYFQNNDKKMNDLYDKMWPHVQNVIDNYVGKPVKFNDLPLCITRSISDYPDFSKDKFEIYTGESVGMSAVITTRYFTFGKLHLTDLNGKKIVKMCNCCNAYETEETKLL